MTAASDTRSGSRRGLRRALAPLWPVPRWLSLVSPSTVKDDAMAGFTNAAIVLPQGVAFAIIAGLPPQYGLHTAMITTVIAAWWGSSTVMVSGPTTAISAILFVTLSKVAEPATAAYVALALGLTVMVGALQLAAGLARVGGLISFISHSVIVGFTAAAALLIAASQLAGALGVKVDRGGGALERIARVIEAHETINLTALAISGVTLLSLILLQMFARRLPYYLIALAIGSGCARLLDSETKGIGFFAPLPSVLPSFHIPQVELAPMLDLLPGAAAIAFVGLLEAISIGRSFALRRNEPYDTNQEIIGQGLSNTLGGFLQAYAGSGSFTRSGLNAESGARTPLAAVFAAVALLGMLLLVAPLVIHIPVPAMAGIILFVAWRLVDVTEIRHIMTSRTEIVILVTTFATGVLFELELAIVAGVITSLLAFIHRSAHPYIGVGAPVIGPDGRRVMRNAETYALPQCPQISVTRIEGNLFFASVEEIERRLRDIDRRNPGQKIRIMGLKGLGKFDLSGADLLISEIRRHRHIGGHFLLIATFHDVINAMRRFGLTSVLGEENLHPNKSTALARAVALADPEVCRTCKLRVFNECAGQPNDTDVPGCNTIGQ